MHRHLTEKLARGILYGANKFKSTISISSATPSPSLTPKSAFSTLMRGKDRHTAASRLSSKRAYCSHSCSRPLKHTSYCHDRAKMELWKRDFHSSGVTQHIGIDRPEPGTGITIHFKDSKGNPIETVEANEGDDLLSIAHEYDIDLEGACERSVACSTCHVILEPEIYDKLPEPEDDENDMLDMAFGLTDTSRLGCQVYMKKELDGLTVTLPSATRNMFVDGKKPRH
ncbi:hypothetical protein E1B28_008499 [Marasmius oreades]|uniref:2Fe-2S ferredoxin-type domain-containing protein n=1 Tax=Marasmius oreades TaxID=181124 RepID=A0A9P7RZ65_9AGAR|nr:uncharacterized protein E1B28_008499 [Marasmius oreades]KAG7092125.1 hypothetical protein E1B28_008499 [Marasmius oreades]